MKAIAAMGVLAALCLLLFATLPPAQTVVAYTTPAGLAGRVRLQSRTDFTGSTVRIAGQAIATAADGSFMFQSLPVGTYTLTASRPGFVSAQHLDVTTVPGEITTLPEILIPAGDIDGDDDIDLFDLVVLGREFGSSMSKSPTDLNADNQVNIFDLVILAANYGVIGPVNWDDVSLPTPTPTATATATETPIASPTPTMTPSPTPTPVCIDPEATINNVGSGACVRYQVAEVAKSGTSLYLYAHRAGSEEIVFYVLVRSDLWHCWPPPVGEYFLGKQLRVQGRITTSRAYPHILLDTCNQLVVEPPAEPTSIASPSPTPQ